MTPEAPPQPHYRRKLLNPGSRAGAVGTGRGLWGHGRGRRPLRGPQLRPPTPEDPNRRHQRRGRRSGPGRGVGGAGSGGGATAVTSLPWSFLLLTAFILGLRSSLTGIPQPSLPPSLLSCVHRDYPPASEIHSRSSPCLTLFTRRRLPGSVPPSAHSRHPPALEIHSPASSCLHLCFRSQLPCLIICTRGHAPASHCSLLGIPLPLNVTLRTVKQRQEDNLDGPRQEWETSR